MGTAFYVYENKKNYDKAYEGRIGESFYDIKVMELYVKENKKGEPKLWVVTETNQMKESPRLERTIVHFRNGSCKEFLEGDEIKVIAGQTKFNPKSDRIEFYPKLIGKPKLEFRCDRFWGTRPNKKRIISPTAFYDIASDRINFILSPK